MGADVMTAAALAILLLAAFGGGFAAGWKACKRFAVYAEMSALQRQMAGGFADAHQSDDTGGAGGISDIEKDVEAFERTFRAYRSYDADTAYGIQRGGIAEQ